MFGDGRQGGPSGGSEAAVARPSPPRTPSLKRLGPCLRADGPQGARLEFLLVALADDWLSKAGRIVFPTGCLAPCLSWIARRSNSRKT